MAGLLPGVLPDLSLPNLGGLLGGNNPTSVLANPTPIGVNQPQVTADDGDDDDDNTDPNNGLSLITIINGPTSSATSPADATSTPLSDALGTTLQTATTPTSGLSTSATQTFGAMSSGFLDASAAAETAAADGGSGGGMSKGMIATVAGASGAGLVLIIVGVVLFTRSRRGRWPFNRRDDFVTLDDEIEKNSAYNQAKWDPSRSGGFDTGRISRFISNRSRD